MNDFKSFLEQNSIWHEFLSKDDTRKAEQASKITGINLDDIVKSLLFKVGNEFCLVIIQGSKKVSPKKLRKLLNEENVRLADAAEVLDITGFAVGAVPPIGLKNKVKCILGKSIVNKEKVWAGGGAIDRLVCLKTIDIIKYNNPIIEDISDDK